VPSVRTSHDPQARLLSQELSTATFALANALRLRDHRQESIEQACEALEAFELIERGPSDFNVPHKVRENVRSSLELLREGKVELALALLGRAGGAFQDHLLRAGSSRRWRH
jgi:hypothetical protein